MFTIIFEWVNSLFLKIKDRLGFKKIEVIQESEEEIAKREFEKAETNKKISIIYDLFIKSESRILARERKLEEMRLQRAKHRQQMIDNVLLDKARARPRVPHSKTGLIPPMGRLRE